MAKAKEPSQPKRIGDCALGDIAQTPAGWLLVTAQVMNGTLVHLWHPYERRKVSATFGVMDDLAVLSVTKRPSTLPPVAGGTAAEFDPVRG